MNIILIDHACYFYTLYNPDTVPKRPLFQRTPRPMQFPSCPPTSSLHKTLPGRHPPPPETETVFFFAAEERHHRPSTDAGGA